MEALEVLLKFLDVVWEVLLKCLDVVLEVLEILLKFLDAVLEVWKFWDLFWKFSEVSLGGISASQDFDMFPRISCGSFVEELQRFAETFIFPFKITTHIAEICGDDKFAQATPAETCQNPGS